MSSFVIDSFRFASESPRLTIGCCDASSVGRSSCVSSGPAADASFASASDDSCAVTARGTIEPTGVSAPACTARASVALPPSSVIATVSSSVSPAGTSTCAVNEPSALSAATTPFTVTAVTSPPPGDAVAVPVTSTDPAWSCTSDRSGDVTTSDGGDGGGSMHATVAARSSRTVDRERSFSMMSFPSAKTRPDQNCTWSAARGPCMTMFTNPLSLVSVR